MPYIKKEARVLFNPCLETIVTSGELNYLLTQVCQRYLKLNRESYTCYNDVIGALECCKLEISYRQLRNYEDRKARENGDVFEGVSSSNNLAWAGGFFEGEGCFYRHYYKPRENGSRVFRVGASLVQKNKFLLDQFRNVVKCGIVYPDGKEGMFVWKSSKKEDAKIVFDLIRPWLGERRQTTFLKYYAEEQNQVFNPPKPKSLICRKGHEYVTYGRIKSGSCYECNRIYQNKWYHEKRRKATVCENKKIKENGDVY